MAPNQEHFELGKRVRWKNEHGGWEVGSLVLYPGEREAPLRTMCKGRVMTAMRRWHHGDIVLVKEYEDNPVQNGETQARFTENCA